VAWWLWALAMLGLAVLPWLDHLLRRAGRPDLAVLTPDAAAYVLGVVSAVSVGALLASRRPAHPVGWLLLALGLSVAVSGVATGYASYGLLARPGALPVAGYAAIYHSVSVIVWAACIGFVLLLTPTGSLPSPRWRWWAWIGAAAPLVALVSTLLLPLDPPYRSVANPLAVAALTGPLRVVNAVTWVATGLTIPVAAWSLVVRFHRARGVERLQLRWLALAAGLVVVLALAALAPTGNEVLLGWLSAICVALLPLATGAAILRYRLYDLDRIISRTLAYGLLTVLLGGGYAGVILGLGQLLGRDSSLAVAVATLAVAAAFQPARRRIQQAVDRRFNRRRYDATQTIAAFSARLRQQVDLDTLTAELLAVVAQTMQPTRVSLWLRPSQGQGQGGS
jgi:MFS family permease